MNIKRKTPKLTPILLSFVLVFSSVLPAYAAEEAIITESLLEETGIIELYTDSENDEVEVISTGSSYDRRN